MTVELTELEKSEYRAAFWRLAMLNSAFRNQTPSAKRHDVFNIRTEIHEVLAHTIASGLAGGTWCEDDFEPLDAAELTPAELSAERVRIHEECIPWFIVKECCAEWNYDPDPVLNGWWSEMEGAVAENRRSLGLD